MIPPRSGGIVFRRLLHDGPQKGGIPNFRRILFKPGKQRIKVKYRHGRLSEEPDKSNGPKEDASLAAAMKRLPSKRTLKLDAGKDQESGSENVETPAPFDRAKIQYGPNSGASNSSSKPRAGNLLKNWAIHSPSEWGVGLGLKAIPGETVIRLRPAKSKKRMDTLWDPFLAKKLDKLAKKLDTEEVPHWDSDRLPPCFTLTVQPTTTKDRVIEEVTKLCDGLLNKDRFDSDAVVVLVSKRLASWLGDEGFLASFIRPLAPLLSDNLPEGLTVLFAAVDGVNHYHLNHEPVLEGISVIHDHREFTLPGIWESSEDNPSQNYAYSSAPGTSIDEPSSQHNGNNTTGEFSSRSASSQQNEVASIHHLPSQNTASVLPSLIYRLSNLNGMSTGPVEVTVPLANTIFNNGKLHTMIATRWEIPAHDSQGLPKLLHSVVKDTQVIDHPSWRTFSERKIGLLPITPARRIVAGLGNILRQVEIDGKASPASKELEAVVPKLLDAYSRNPDIAQVERLKVWAILMPEKTVGRLKPPPEMEVFKSMQSIREKLEICMEDFRFALSEGVQVRRVLSGGGGWGPKQGLLSLDPQTRYTKDDDRDIDDFIKSFIGGEEYQSSVSGQASHVQFFIEPPQSNANIDVSRYKKNTPTMLITTPGQSRYVGLHGDDVGLMKNVFGVCTSQGYYLSYRPKHGDGEIAMKFDFTGATLMVTGLRPAC